MSTPTHAPAPRVGVGVIVLREGKVLLGQRIGAHGAGTWALPGGHLEFGESIEQCALRETQEETGLQVEVLAPGPYTNDPMPEDGRHYVTAFVLARADRGEPVVREPQKCLRWAWFAWDELPSPLFQPLQSLIAQGFTPLQASVDAFIRLVEAGQTVEAMERFYAEHASMQENAEAPRTGKPALIAHERAALASIARLQARCVRPVFTAGDRVVLRWVFEIEDRKGRCVRFEELAYQRWEAGLIAEEQFFYDPGQLAGP